MVPLARWTQTDSLAICSRPCAGEKYVINSTVWRPGAGDGGSVVANGESVNGRTVWRYVMWQSCEAEDLLMLPSLTC